MKKSIALLLSIALILIFSLSTMIPAAQARASDYYSSYSGSISQNSDGTITAYFSVTAVSTMTTLGAKTITIEQYNSSTKKWSTVYTFSSSTTTSMLKSNTMGHAKSVTTGTSFSSGTYKATITLYATNSAGNETVTYSVT